MLGLQEYFDQLIKEEFKVHKLGVRILQKDLKSIGLDLSASQREDLEVQFKHLGQGSLKFDFSENQLYKAGFSSEADLKPILIEVINNLPKSIEAFSCKIDGMMENVIFSIVDEMAESVNDSLQLHLDETLEEWNSIQNAFDDDVYDIWGDALDLLQGLIVVSDEAAQGYIERSDEYSENDLTQRLLVRFLAKANNISKEILSLLTHGYAEGAQARWRSLHELAVVCSFIANHGDSVAERFVEHESVEIYKGSKQYNQYYTRLGAEKIDDSEMTLIESDYLKLINKYGKSYGSDYGWAASALNLKRPTFRDIEASVELDHIRPYYKIASANVHTNPAGVFSRLGLFPEEDFLLSGPSAIGLSDPAQSTVNSLVQVTTSVLMYGANIDFLVVSKSMHEFGKVVVKKFLEIENEIYTHRDEQ